VRWVETVETSGEYICAALCREGGRPNVLGGAIDRRTVKTGKELRMDGVEKSAKDEADVREVIQSWLAAIKRKDFAGILQNHSPDIVMFDVPPPFQSRGIDAYRATWDLFFACSSYPVVFDITEMNIIAGADVAFAVATMRCTEPGDHGQRESLHFRLTMGLRKINGQWIIMHEHHSVPALD
jgi:uncharacterized protein (TIGR02246 family)